MKHPQLMSGCEAKQLYRRPPEEVAQARWSYTISLCRMVAQDTAQRVTKSKEHFPWKFFRGDCHSHTQHSDGHGTVAETAGMVKAAGLDFQYVTDHWGVTQAEECRQHGLWIGQEPPTQHHHMGILGLDHAFTPQMDFLKDIADAKALGATVFVPHPAGWWNRTVYNEEQKAILEKLPDPFLMEICNGAGNIINAFDYTDKMALEVWDRLLNLGRVVHAMGNTDAHTPHGIGIVWNGVFASDCTQENIIRSLSAGASFVSDGPLVHIQMGQSKMGSRVSAGDRDQSLAITAVDSRGLIAVRVVGDGKELGYWPLRGDAKWERAISVPQSIHRYVRVEVRSEDGRQAYSNPIYLPKTD